MDSMTTGFNISIDILRDVRVNSMIDLTHDEVKYLIKDIDAYKQTEIVYLMIDNYGGYV